MAGKVYPDWVQGQKTIGTTVKKSVTIIIFILCIIFHTRRFVGHIIGTLMKK